MKQPSGREAPIWQPADPEETPMSIYRRHVNNSFGLGLKNSIDLHEWTVTRPHDFWIDIYKYCELIPPLVPAITKAFDSSRDISSIPHFFPDHSLNYAENILSGRNALATAIIGLREGQTFDGKQGEFVTWEELTERVRKLRSGLLRHGVCQGDRVAALMGNSGWTIAIFLAAAAMGAIFTSINPDMGADGCVSRLRQVQPKILFADSHATYKGKNTELKQKISDILDALKPLNPLYFIVPVHPSTSLSSGPSLQDFLAKSSPKDPLIFTRLPFPAPLLILYSSGTSGPPKCIVHSHGLILQHKKIALLHNSLTASDTVMAYSSTSWVVWNVMVGYLSVGATVICYDGSPLYPSAKTMLQLVQNYRACFFATSPRYLLELEKETAADGKLIKDQFNLDHLRLVTTTGATLTASAMRAFYASFPRHVHLSSVAGGTDIATSWLATNPAGPVFAGQIQMAALGMAVDVADEDLESAVSVKDAGEAGEMVCRVPFPSMPPFFWGDEGGVKYRESYFARYKMEAGAGAWAQHDRVEYVPETGGWVMHGRSDATLNPSGIRFGSADIYGVLEADARLRERVAESLCVGRKRAGEADEVVFLFLKMKERHSPLTRGFVEEIRNAIRKGLSNRHVPTFIEEVRDVPVTVNGKKVEIAVKKILAGEKVRVSSTVANPSCLEEYRKFATWGDGQVEVQLKAKL